MRKQVAVKILIPIFALAFVLLLVFLYVRGINRPSNFQKAGSTTEILINKGESLDDISANLSKDGLINSRVLFKLYVIVNRKVIQAGRYYVPANLNMISLVELLGKGSFDLKLTFLEGWTKDQIASYLDKKFSSDFGAEFLEDPSTKEGYMFPDTYFFAEKTVTPNVISKALRDNFEEKVSSLQNEISPSGMSLDNVIILASIVEREAKSYEDRKIVAGILLKRMGNGWPLQADATVQYIRDKNNCPTPSANCTYWGPLSSSDLSIASPYNTYINKGLPPTPICNPGLESIKAVLNYEETDYWYYLSDKDGNMHFAKTVGEHNENIKKYL